MGYYSLATLEILLVIVSPLLFLYLRGPWALRSIIPSLFIIPILWYLTYSVLHELSHVAGTYLVGGTVSDFKLIPRFWLGEFGRAWITTVGITGPGRQLVLTGFPYALDVVSVLAGLFLLRRPLSVKPFLVGFLFMLLVLRPAFDFVCEPIAFLMGDKGDFYAISGIVGTTLTWAFILSSLTLCILTLQTIVRRFRAADLTGPPGNPNSGTGAE